ncbi:inactive phospholipase C-like protein 2 isoform X2 [Watersipora subatra]|uniref:inactive phospholipase C-like protein 2 isoform X2 n=1 Tax=Watersipora subatra TaxID=2589382 RepID=UPI00355C540F
MAQNITGNNMTVSHSFTSKEKEALFQRHSQFPSKTLEDSNSFVGDIVDSVAVTMTDTETDSTTSGGTISPASGDETFIYSTEPGGNKEPQDTNSATNEVPRNGFSSKPKRHPSILSNRTSRQKVKKSVSFCSMPEDRRVSNAKDCLALMQEGTELTKLKTNGRLYRRYYWLDNASTEIRWMPTSKSYNKSKIVVNQIKEVQGGRSLDSLKNKDIECICQEEYMLTILYGSNYTSLDLIAKTPDEANIWLAGLSHLITKRDVQSQEEGSLDDAAERRKSSIRDRWLVEMFVEEAGSYDELLREQQAGAMVMSLNPAVDVEYMKLKLKELYAGERAHSKGLLTCQEFVSLYKDVASRQEIYFLMTKYGNSSDCMNAEDLMLFLETEQGVVDVCKRRCEELISRYEPSREGKSKLLLGVDGLLAYLLSKECNIFDEKWNRVFQDMDQPLSHYFINSSHKTYLLEDQLKGPSSVAAYSRVLKQGCRYIEVDCWDGPSQPIVYHGRTLTSRILFSDVISAINEYAFATSPYPVILSIENHCSLDQQQLIVNTLKSTLGDKLYSWPISDDSHSLPSPEKLKYKILIKCKKLEDDDHIISPHGEVSEEDESIDPDWKKLHKKEPVKKISMLRELSDLVNWCQSCSYDKFNNHRNSQKPWHITSVSDMFVHKSMESSAVIDEFITCNKHCLTRVYPSCARVDSSNFNPQPYWNCGFQIVALNQQSQGLESDLNVARFKQNGSCGYILKPTLLRELSIPFNPQSGTPQNLPGIVPQLLQIKIISGHRFPKPRGSCTKSSITDPYVLLDVFGLRVDRANARTKTVPGNGQNPFFDESFTFYIHFPEMTLIRFNILDDDFIGDEFIAQYTLPFTCMSTGYRHINLLSSAGDEIPGCTLFVHITTTPAVDKKPMRRGNSVLNKVRVVKEPITIKPVGMKAMDEASKLMHSHMLEAAELRYNVEYSLVKFKEACDVGSVANIKHCIRTIANRAFSTKGLNLQLVLSRNLPLFLISEGTPPDILKKALQAYHVWCKECNSLIDEGETQHQSLLKIKALLQTLEPEMSSYMKQSSVSEKKTQKALENYAWNLRVLTEQINSLNQYTETCKNSFMKVVEAAQSYGVEVVDNSSR